MQTAENVARRYAMPRERRDHYGAQSQQRACAAQAAGLFADEIVSCTVLAGLADPKRGMRSQEVTISRDEGLREGTTYDSIKDIRTAVPGGVVTAGNASQFSDGAGACVVVDEQYAQRKGLAPLGTSSASRWPAASPTRWASARSSPCPSCCSAWACAWTTSTCGS
jgi:acetyl-CoA C-acetyltransferase